MNINARRLLEKIDIIGPDVRLFNMKKTGTRDQTIFGGLLSIIVECLAFVASFYFFSDIVFKTNPKAYQVTQFKDDVPKLTFDHNGMFFGIQYTNPQNPNINLYNERAVTFYGKIQTFKSGQILAYYKLQKCIYKTDFLGLEDLFPPQDYEADINNTYLCVGSMIVNNTEIPKSDPNYIVPHTMHGMGSKSKDPVFFEVGANRCINTTENGKFCLPDDEISKMLIGSNYKINFIDNMFDTNSYTNPLFRFVHQIDGQASPTNFAGNYMNLINIRFQTHDGLVMDNINGFDSYQFNDRVEIVSPIVEGSPNVGRIFMFRLELQNTPKLFERYYTRLQEVLGSIGGVIKFLFVCAKILDYLFNFLTEDKNILLFVFEKYINNIQSKNVAPQSPVWKRRINVLDLLNVTNLDNPPELVMQSSELVSISPPNKSGNII